MNSWTDDQTEVRYHFLRPAEVVKRREAIPVAWVPLGTIEWHGEHNPLGSDALQAEGIGIISARRGGGLVMPPVYFGEPRSRGEIVETQPSFRNDLIAQAMHIPVSNFDQDRFPFSKEEQQENYSKLLLQILYEVQSLGFLVCAFIAGHYPLISSAQKAVVDFCSNQSNPMTAWAFVDYELVSDQYDYAGDHAAFWETSHMMSLYPDRVDLDLLPPKGEPLVGIMPNKGMLPQDANGEFGYKIIEQVADLVIAEVNHRLANPTLYRGVNCLDKGKWKLKYRK